MHLFFKFLPFGKQFNDISCIKAGRYVVRWTYSPLFDRYTYQVMNVTGRRGIRIHSGNFADSEGKSDIRGCILLGYGYSDIDNNGLIDITNSRNAVRDFEKFMDYKTFEIIITDC